MSSVDLSHYLVDVFCLAVTFWCWRKYRIIRDWPGTAKGRALDNLGGLSGLIREKRKVWVFTIRESDKKFRKRILEKRLRQTQHGLVHLRCLRLLEGSMKTHCEVCGAGPLMFYKVIAGKVVCTPCQTKAFVEGGQQPEYGSMFADTVGKNRKTIKIVETLRNEMSGRRLQLPWWRSKQQRYLDGWVDCCDLILLEWSRK